MATENANTMLGTILFKQKDDSEEFDIVRITRIYNPEKVRVTDSEGNFTKKTLQQLKDEGYTKLDSIGVLSFSIVEVNKSKDVIVTLLKKTDAMMGLTVPCVICRQSVTDFFYTLLAQERDHKMVGVSASEKTCPANIPYEQLLACDGIIFSHMIHIYYDDTIDSILECVNQIKFNDTLRELFDRHIKAENNLTLKFRKDSHNGWCTNIKQLLVENNFWIDVDQAYNITDVDFDMKNYIIEKSDKAGKSYNSLTSDVTRFFCSTFELNIVDTIIIEYGYDIDLAEYHNENYVLIRDCNEKLWLMVYLTDGAFLQQDLAIQKEQENLAHQYGLKIYNKYKEQTK